jgi:acetoacetate decarboxylase
MTGFVRTDEELAEIRDRQARNRFLDTRALSVRFRTDPAIVERVLPPGLEPAGEPTARAEVVEVGRSNCVGGFAGGGLYVGARHGDLTGEYCLWMPMSTVTAIVWGRELLGEPKKLAEIDLERDGDRVTGRVVRHGESVLELDATLEAERPVDGADDDPATVFHYKYQPDVSGEGFQYDPTLVRSVLESDLDHLETGTGTVELASTVHDPLGDLPVESVRGVAYTESDLVVSGENLTTVDPEAFAPYAFGTGRAEDPLAFPDEEDASAALD